MQRYAIKTTRFFGSIVSTLTSRKAARFYRATGRNVGQTLVFAWNLFLLACEAAILAGALTRDLWEAFCEWADRYVESCTYHPVAVTLALPPVAAPIALLPPARERRQRPIIAPWAEDRVLITPHPVYMQTSTQAQPKRKRGRPKKKAA